MGGALGAQTAAGLLGGRTPLERCAVARAIARARMTRRLGPHRGECEERRPGTLLWATRGACGLQQDAPVQPPHTVVMTSPQAWRNV